MNEWRRHADAETAADIFHADGNGSDLGVLRVAIIAPRIAQACAEAPRCGIALLFLFLSCILCDCESRHDQRCRRQREAQIFCESVHVHSPKFFHTQRSGSGQVATLSEPADDPTTSVTRIVTAAAATPATVVTGDIVTTTPTTATTTIISYIAVSTTTTASQAGRVIGSATTAHITRRVISAASAPYVTGRIVAATALADMVRRVISATTRHRRIRSHQRRKREACRHCCS
jgi:hypothetical protein